MSGPPPGPPMGPPPGFPGPGPSFPGPPGGPPPDYTGVIDLALVLFEWLRTLDREVVHYWRFRRAFHLGTVLYFLNRVLPISLCSALLVATTKMFSPTSISTICPPLQSATIVLTALVRANVQVIMSLRTYALYGCSKLILTYLLGLTSAGFVFTVVATSPSMRPPPPPPPEGDVSIMGCMAGPPAPFPAWELCMPLIIFEFSVLFFTSVQMLRYARHGFGKKSKLVVMMVRDGFLGSLAISICTLIGLVFEIVKPPGLVPVSRTLNPIVPSLIASIILLDIRDIMRTSVNEPSPMESIRHVALDIIPSQPKWPSITRHLDQEVDWAGDTVVIGAWDNFSKDGRDTYPPPSLPSTPKKER